MGEASHSPDFARRFGGISRIYGAQGAAQLQATHSVVIGIGGVGSWAVEALARSGVGRITMIDQDVIAESNINRQLHSLSSTLGQDKAAAMAARIAEINPACLVNIIDEWITPENVAALLPFDASGVLDCIDQVRPKAALAALCVKRKIPLIVCGAAGGKTDPAALKIDDLALTFNDPLLAKLRNTLRKDYGFAKGTTKGKAVKLGVQCVYSSQPVGNPWAELSSAPQGLNCTGYGSLMHMTASMGLFAAGALLNKIAKT